MLELLVAHGLDAVEVTGTSRATAEAALARAVQAHAPDMIISVGGDGTHSVAAQAAVATDIPLGVVAAGTGNDLARALGLPRNDPDAAVAVALAGVARRIDTARVSTAETEREYLTVLTCGFDSLVADRTAALRWPPGRARYLTAIGVEYLALRARPMTVIADGVTVMDGPAILCAVGNTGSYGGGLQMCAQADPGDGLLDLTAITDVRRPHLELVRVLPRIARGTHLSHPAARTVRARTFEIHATGIPGYADGDPVGPAPLRVTAHPGALRVMTARTSASADGDASVARAHPLQQRRQDSGRDHLGDVATTGGDGADQ